MSHELVEVEQKQSLAIANFDAFMAETDEIQILFNKIVDKYQLKKDSLTTTWYEGKFSLCVNLPQLRSV